MRAQSARNAVAPVVAIALLACQPTVIENTAEPTSETVSSDPDSGSDAGQVAVDSGDANDAAENDDDDELRSAIEEHYSGTRVLRYDLEIDGATFAAMLADPLCSSGTTPCGDEYAAGTLRYGDEVYPNVGIRFKGNSSRWMVARAQQGDAGYQRYSFKVDLDKFAEEQSLHGIKKLNLNNAMHDPSYLREHLAYGLFRNAGVPASRVGFVDLYVNGEHFGLYVNVQQVDKKLLRQWFEDEDGNLYKPETGDLVYHGDTIDAYTTDNIDYQLKTNEDIADHSALLDFIDVLNNTADADFAAAIEQVFEVDRFLSWLAVNSLLVALDSYAGSIAHNYYLYHDPSTGRFSYLPWDENNAFGTFRCGGLTDADIMQMAVDVPFCQTSMAGPGGNPGPIERPLIERVLAVDSYRQRYHDKLQALVDGAFSTAAMQSAIAAGHDLIASYVQADPKRLYTYEQFEQSLSSGGAGQPGLASFVADRGGYVRDFLAGTTSVACGDGTCSEGENCTVDCAASTTCAGPCEVYVAAVGHCVPGCAGTCTCPTDAPVALTCDSAIGACVPTAPTCNCQTGQVCAPNGQCVPRCTDDSTCPAQVPFCNVTSGLCQPTATG